MQPGTPRARIKRRCGQIVFYYVFRSISTKPRPTSMKLPFGLYDGLSKGVVRLK